MKRDIFVPGDRFGEFEIEGRLRAGGMATLFFARRHSAAGVSREVVIKVIHPHLAESDLIVRMFIDEARISSRIRHSNVVSVETFGEHDGVFYIVMEYVDGCSLEQLLRTLSRRKEQLSPEVACHIAMEIAAGLHAAHETVDDDGAPLGIVHRDISPSNVLVTRDGRIKVIDFGIAKARNRLSDTRTGDGLKGKLRYMSPEQAFGREIDRRADVYALGIVLWELLTIQPLFRHPNELALLDLVRAPDVPAPSTHNPNVTQALDAVVARALAPAVDARTPSAQELRQELMRAVPLAMSVPVEVIGQLVGHVRETLGSITLDTQLRRHSKPRLVTEEVNPTTPDEIELSTSDLSSVRGAVGEVVETPVPKIPHAPARRRTAWLAAGIVAASASAAIIIAMRDPDPIEAPVTRIEPSAVTAPIAPVVEAPPPPPAEPTPKQVEPVEPRPSPKRVTRSKDKSRPQAKQVKEVKEVKEAQEVEVNGVTLADEPTVKTRTPRPNKKKKPEPRPVSSEVDGTVLAE
jgi:serine/threonine protein kinase